MLKKHFDIKLNHELSRSNHEYMDALTLDITTERNFKVCILILIISYSMINYKIIVDST